MVKTAKDGAMRDRKMAKKKLLVINEEMYKKLKLSQIFISPG